MVTPSSGNVFADLGLPDAGRRLLRADLIIALRRRLDALSTARTW